MLDYQVGDTVIHQQYGLGEIIEMDEKVIHERQTLCYVVRLQHQLTIWVSADEPGNTSIRLPTPEGSFENMFDILRAPGTLLPLDRLERKTLLMERLKMGDLASVCSVIRDLVLFRQEKRLNEHDKSTLDRARSLLVAEWAYSLAVTSAQASNGLVLLLGV